MSRLNIFILFRDSHRHGYMDATGMRQAVHKPASDGLIFRIGVLLFLTLGVCTIGYGDNMAADELVFFSALDLEREELAAVRRAVDSRDWKGAKEAWAAPSGEPGSSHLDLVPQG